MRICGENLYRSIHLDSDLGRAVTCWDRVVLIRREVRAFTRCGTPTFWPIRVRFTNHTIGSRTFQQTESKTNSHHITRLALLLSHTSSHFLSSENQGRSLSSLQLHSPSDYHFPFPEGKVRMKIRLFSVFVSRGKKFGQCVITRV